MLTLKVFQGFRLRSELPANVSVSHSKVANSVCNDLSFSQFPVWFIIEEILFVFGLICAICLSHVLKLVCLLWIFAFGFSLRFTERLRGVHLIELVCVVCVEFPKPFLVEPLFVSPVVLLICG